MSKKLHFEQVASTNIGAIAHDAVAGELHVQFKNGSHYVYAGVPRTTYEKMRSAESVGKFLQEHVKGKFDHRKL